MSHENLENKNVYILNFGKVSTTNQTKRNQRKVLRSVCGPRRAMRGRCTGCDARTSTDWLHLRDALRGRCTGCDARTAEGDARSLYGMRCADLYGLVAFARCAARSLYGMRCADLCGLVAFARCAVQDAMRGPLRTGCICAVRCVVVPLKSCPHAFDGGILRVRMGGRRNGFKSWFH